jgi:hypothetical protein
MWKLVKKQAAEQAAATKGSEPAERSAPRSGMLKKPQQAAIATSDFESGPSGSQVP